MLIRCTHCNHELRVPDQQISATGTRVLCKSCNTIFVARRGAEEPARAQSDILPVADDPALEEALDRILDRGPLSEAMHDEEPGGESDTLLGDDHAGGSASTDPWAQVSPESLGISLVDDEPAAPAPEHPAPVRAAPPSDTGGDDVDQLLDQVLRDLDRQQPPPPSAAPPRPDLEESEDLLAGLSLEEPSDTIRPPAPPLPATPSPPSPPALDLESILSEIRSEAGPPAPPTTRISPPTTTISSGFDLDEDDLGGGPGDLGFGDASDGPEAGATESIRPSGAHEREQSLHDIYESGQGHPLTDAVDGDHTPAATDLALGTGAVAQGAAQRKPRPTGQHAGTGTVRTRTAASKAKAGSASSPWSWVVVLALVLAAAGGGGYWFWTQERVKPGAAGTEPGAPGLPTFAFEQQDGQLVKVKGGLAYVVSGVVRNTSSFAVYIIRVSGVLRGANGQEVGRAASYAGNSIDVSSLSRVPRAEVGATLDTRIGEGGSNVKIEPMGALRFTLVFWDAPSDASNPELSASARSFPPPSTSDG
jgi:predicted Zn finger-like uncharacterized protein